MIPPLILAEKYKSRKQDWGYEWVGRNFLEHPHFDWDDPAAFCLGPKGVLSSIGFGSIGAFEKMKLSPAVCPLPATRKSQGILNYAFTFFDQKSSFKVSDFESKYYGLIQKLTGLSKESLLQDYDVHMVNLQTELDSSSVNSIGLDPDAVDDFGLPRVVLNVGFTDALHKTVNYALRNLQRDLIRLGGVLVRVKDNPSFFMGGAHPMGTTRMANDYRGGVVDSRLKIFGLKNAYICSGSTFPTGGYANPTFTLVCLAINLAQDILKEV